MFPIMYVEKSKKHTSRSIEVFITYMPAKRGALHYSQIPLSEKKRLGDVIRHSFSIEVSVKKEVFLYPLLGT